MNNSSPYRRIFGQSIRTLNRLSLGETIKDCPRSNKYEPWKSQSVSYASEIITLLCRCRTWRVMRREAASPCTYTNTNQECWWCCHTIRLAKSLPFRSEVLRYLLMRDKDETVHVASRSQSDNRLQLYVVPSTKSLECTNAEDHPRFKDLDIFGPSWGIRL